MVDEQSNEDDGREPDAKGDPGGGPGGRGDTGGEGDPEGLPGGRIPAPPIPRDEWVENVIDDPASTVRPVLLQGYVGDAAEEDYTRIYPDASLGSYVDVRNEDVLYHQPLEGDHAPRGGSMVWIRGDAQVSQGTAPAAGADFFTGPVLAQNRQGVAGAAQPAAQMHITLLTVAGCFTRGIYCPPQNTAATLCTQRIACSHVCQQQGGIGGPGWGAHDAEGAVFPSLFCPSKPSPCNQFELPGDRWQPQLMRAAANVGPTGYQGCGHDAGGGQGPIGVTGWQGCGQGPIGVTGWQGCGQGPIGVTGWQGCGQPHISLPGCIQTGTCGTGQEAGGGQGPIGVTGWLGCGQPHISLPGCIQTGTCAPQGAGGGLQGAIGVTGWQGCGQGPIGVTGWLGCGQPHISLPGCVYTGTCAPQGAGGGLQGAVTGPDSTIATVCTQFSCRQTGYGCPRTSTCPPTFTPGCGPETEHGGSTAATLCTQVPFCPLTGHCPPGGANLGAAAIPTGQYSPACPSFGFTCTYIHCPPGGANLGAAAPQGAAAIPTGQYSPACPSFGFTCTYVHCPPAKGEAPPQDAAAIATHSPGCPTLGFTCTYIHCPPVAGAAAAAQALAAIPTYSPACPTLGFTCTYLHCLPVMGTAAALQGAAAIPTYSPGCHTFGFTCTAFC